VNAASQLKNCHLFHAALSSVLKIEAECSTERLVRFQRTARRYIPEHGTLQTNNANNEFHQVAGRPVMGVVGTVVYR
jgi:hypothetical protein